jgi:hypothetical protein
MIGIILFLIFGTIPFIIKNYTYTKNKELFKFSGFEYSKKFIENQDK